MKQAKALFWSIYVDIIFDGVKPPEAIGGADVQQAFWTKCFRQKGWKSYSFYYRWDGFIKESHDILFLYLPLVRKLMFFINYLKYFWLIIIRPDIVVVRTKDENVKLLRFFSRLLKYKLVYMIASDVEFEPTGNKRKRRKQLSLHKIPYVIAQNEYQKKTFEELKEHKGSIPVISNIWYRDPGVDKSGKGSDRNLIVWVGNLREIKRPQWFIDLARDLPEYDFQMIGAVLDQDLYQQCLKLMSGLNNISYLGFKSLQEVNQIIEASRLLVCTSIAEGFPNTFLQAWSYSIPVLSTVDPNKVITRYNLGAYAKEYDGLLQGAKNLLSNQEQYRSSQESIKQYFDRNHNPDQGYKILTDYLTNS